MQAPDVDICERPRVAYDFLHFGERGENARVDAAFDMLDAVFRLPRMLDADPGLETVSHPMTLADGTQVRCRGVEPEAQERDCRVPDWQAYLGAELGRYDQFILFGLRMTGPLVYVQQHAPVKRLRARYRERTGRSLSRAGVEALRLSARNTAIALFDSFVKRGHQRFALSKMPECYQGEAGYKNPNAAWAPELDQLDPTLAVNARGRLSSAADVPVDCAHPSGLTYLALRASLWDRHATAYRALVLANAYQQFRGILSQERRRAWLSLLRETGDALALPSGYEAGNNHGITQATALIQLAHDFGGVDPNIIPRSVSDAWLDLGRHRLNDVIVDTVFPDGVQVEQSPFYHNYQLGLLLLVTKWLRSSGIQLTDGIDPAYHTGAAAIPGGLRRDYDSTHAGLSEPDVNGLNPSSQLDPGAVLDEMVRAAVHLAQPDGWIPTIGSSLPQQLRGYYEQAMGEYARGGHLYSQQLLFYRSAGTRGEPPPDGDRIAVFESSGFVTMHSAFEPNFERQTHLVFNTGVPYHRHSHADALAVHLYGPAGTGAPAPGLPLLIDPGWFSYRAEGRHYFESTLAHNTVHVDGANQCTREPIGKRTSPHVDVPLVACAELADEARASARHQLGPAGRVVRGLTARGDVAGQSWSYQSAVHGLYRGVAHRRAVMLVGHAMLVVLDELESDGPRTFSQTWHLPPSIPRLRDVPPVERGTRHFFFARSEADAAPLFSLHQAEGAGLEVLLHHGVPAGDSVPDQGWFSTAENHRQPSLVVELRQREQVQAAFASVFLLGESGSERADVALHESGPGDLSLAIELDRGASFRLRVTGLAAGAPIETVALEVTGGGSSVVGAASHPEVD